MTYGNRLCTHKLLARFRHSFDAIIVPRPMFLRSFKSLNKNKNIPPIVILFTELIGKAVDDDKLTLLNVFDRTFLEGDGSIVELVRAFLLWGDKTLIRVKKHYPDMVDKFTVVGHPRHDEKCTNITFAQSEGEKIRVGFLTRQDMLNDFMDRKPVEMVVRSSLNLDAYWYNNEKTGDFLRNPANNAIDEMYLQAREIDIMLRVINSLDRDRYEIFLRVHPRENKDTWIQFAEKYKINVKLNDWRTPFSHWAKSMDYVIGPASTCFFDCCMLGVRPISIQNIDPIYHKHLKGSFAEEFNTLTEHIDKPESIESLLELIKSKGGSFVPSEEIRDILSLEADYPNCKSSISKIVDKCLALAETNNRSQFVKHVNFVLFYFCSRMLTVLVIVVHWFQKKSEQGSTFFLTRKNTKFIDSLAGD